MEFLVLYKSGKSKNRYLIVSSADLAGIIKEKIIKIMAGNGITLTNNEIKDIIRVKRSLENKRILLNGTALKIISQEGGLLNNFLGLLMKVGLWIMKNVLT